MYNKTVERQKKRIIQLKEQVVQLQQENERLRQDNNDKDKQIEVLMLELAETRESVNAYIEQLEHDIANVQDIKNKYKSLISSVRKKKTYYQKQMKSTIKEFNKEIK